MRRIFGGPSAPDPRFIAGTVAEIEELFGGRVPELPDGPLDPATGDLFLVDLFPPLRKCLRDLVEYLYRGLTATAGGGEHAAFTHGSGAAPLDQFEQVLETVLASVIEQERRLGLMNLFWLAHSKAVAEVLQDFFSQPRIKLDLKYQMHPFLQGVHRNAFERVWG